MRRPVWLLAAMAVTAPHAAHAGAVLSGKCARSIAAVRQVETAWLASYAARDAGAMAAVLTDDFTITHPNANVETGRDVVAGIRRKAGTAGPRFTTRDVAGRCFGDTVILTGWVGAAGSSEARYTDTYVRFGRRWKVAASHLSRPRTATW